MQCSKLQFNILTSCHEFYLGKPQKQKPKKAVFVATGFNSTALSSIEILTEDKNGIYISKQIDMEGCSAIPEFPIATSSGVGAFFNGMPHVCAGYPSTKCFGFSTNGSWENDFNLTRPLIGGSSVLLKKDWWIMGGDQNGFGTELWGGYPPSIINNAIQIPEQINTSCLVNISYHEVFVIAMDESSKTSFAWIFNIQSEIWTRVKDPIEQRNGSACGYFKNSTGRFVVLAGGFQTSTTEIFSLDSQTWSMGPSIGLDLFGASMVSVSGNEELLLIGGKSKMPLTQIMKMNSTMRSWKNVGNLTTPRFNAIAIDVPLDKLPNLCPPNSFC